MKRVRVLHISSNGGIGGREKILYSMLSENKGNLRYEQEIYLKYAEGPYFELMKKENIKVFTSQNNIFANLRDNIRLFKNFDFLVFHFVSWELFLAAAFSDARRFYMLSGIYLLTKKSFRGILANYFNRFCRKLFLNNRIVKMSENQTELDLMNIKFKWSSFHRLFKRWFFMISVRSFFDTVIVNSQYSRTAAIANYGIPQSKIKLIYNGVKCPTITRSPDLVRAELGILQNEFVIGTVCRYDSRKRIDRLLQGFYGLSDIPSFKLLIVGGGDEILEKQFKQSVEKSNLTSRIIFTGPRMDAADLMNSMDLFVLSSDNESFGLALVEAMLLRKPTVVFRDSGGPAEIVDSFGYVIRDPHELRKIALTLSEYPDIKERLVKAAYIYAMDMFSMKRFLRECQKVYEVYLP